MRKIRMNPDTLTIGDMEAFEDYTGLDLMEVLKPTPVINEETGMPVPDPDPAKKGRPLMEFKISSKVFRGLLYITLLKDDPNLTPAEFRKIQINDFDFDLEEGEENLKETGETKETHEEPTD